METRVNDKNNPRVPRRTLLKGGATVAACSALAPWNGFGTEPAPRELPYDEYARHDGLGLAELVRKGEVTAHELLDAAIARLDAVNPTINAIAGTLYDMARDSIERGLPEGPFTGVPFLVKDLSFAIKDVEAAYGSRLFQGQIASEDSTAVARYREAGLVLFARTHVPELGGIPTTESALAGVTCNPYKLGRTAGGSSGGSASAVAAGVAPMASASDGGGSIRIPASCCGLFGLKPTRARIPVGPLIFESWGGLAVVHAVTRSVRDSAALLDATAGPELGDSYVAPHFDGKYLDEVGKPPGKLRVALVRTMPPVEFVHPVCLEAVKDAAELCESLGHQVEECTDEFAARFDFNGLRQASGITLMVALRRRIRDRLKQLGRDLRDDDLEPLTRGGYELASMFTGEQVEDARDAYFRAARSMAAFQRNYDVVLTPTLAMPPIEHGKITMSGRILALLHRLPQFMPCTQMANWTGQPAMSIPLYHSGDGLPIGVQFMGRFGDEATLLRLAGQLEKARPWADRRPALSPA